MARGSGGGGGSWIGAVFEAIGSWYASSKVAQVVWTAFKITALAVGVKNWRTTQDLLSKGQDILATKVAAGGKIPVVYGTRRIGSQLVFLDTADNRSKDLFCVYALCVGEIDKIDSSTIEINGVSINDSKVFRQGYYAGSDAVSSGAGSLNTVTQVGDVENSNAGTSGTDPAKRYRMVFNCHHGAASQTVDPMLTASISSKWTSSHKLNGIAYIAASFEFDTKAMFKGLPELTVVVRGKKIYDPRDSGQTFGTASSYEYSDNPALCFLDYITNNEYGKGLVSGDITMSTFTTAANACDTLVNTPDFNGSASAITFDGTSGNNYITTSESVWTKLRPADVVTLVNAAGSNVYDEAGVDATSRYQYYDSDQENRVYFNSNLGASYSSNTGTVLAKNKRFQCHGLVDTNLSVMENAKDLLANMRGIFNFIDGKFELKIEDTGTSTFSVTEDHIIDDGGITIDYGSKDERYNKVVVGFYNAQKGYEADTVTVLHSATTDATDFTSDDGGEELELKVDFPYISSPYVAYNMGRAILVRSRYQTQISFHATPELYKCNVGDIIDITYSPLELSSSVYRIETMELLPNGLLNVTAIIYYDVYTYTLPSAANVSKIANLPSPFALQTPTGLSFVDTDTSATGRAYLTWTAVTTYPVNEYRVIVQNASSVDVYNKVVNSNYAFLDMLPTGSYTAKISAINSVKAESDQGSLSFSIADPPTRTADIQPSAVTAAKVASGTLTSASGVFGVISANDVSTGTLSANLINLNGTTLTGDTDGLKITTSGITTNELAIRSVGAFALNGASGTSAFGDGRSGDSFNTLSTITFTSADAGDYLVVGNCMVGGVFASLTQLESRIIVGTTTIAEYSSPVGASAIQPIILAGKITLSAATSYTASLQGQVTADNTTPDVGGFSTRISVMKLSKQS